MIASTMQANISTIANVHICITLPVRLGSVYALIVTSSVRQCSRAFSLILGHGAPLCFRYLQSSAAPCQ
jgi:hypothetical protein